MAKEKLNPGLRILLKIATLIAIGYWGWKQHMGVLRYALAFSLPVTTAVFWIMLPARGEACNGLPDMAIPGPTRLFLEFAFFGFATWGLYDTGSILLAFGLGIAVIIHYLISFDRLYRLLKN